MKIFKRILTLSLLFLFCITLIACGKKKVITKKNNTSNVTNSTTTKKNTTKKYTTQKTETKGIGKDGGEISDKNNNVKLVIPKDALDTDTLISARFIAEQETIGEATQLNFLGGAEFGPSGTKFNKPVEVTLNLVENSTFATVAIFCYDETNKCWNYETEAKVTNGQAKFSVTHFSRYEALNLTPEMFNKYETLVKTAKTNGYNDAWITNSYYNYLVNDMHVIDYYNLYDGYYYEACYLNIMGDYFLSGTEGDQEALWKETGESNKVGNTYGLSKIGSMTSSYEEYKKEKNKPASERKDIIYVSVIIEYKMIEPQIDATPSKSNLLEGETDTIQVRCHYVNPSNYFYPDFDMDNYTLTISVSNLTTDKTSLLTDASGKDSFTVTSTSDDEKKTAKIQFYVAGAWGAYSASYVNYGEEGDYSLSGHITETLDFNYRPKSQQGWTETPRIGEFKLKVEYDLSGNISVDDETGALTGSISISNIKTTLQTSGGGCYYTITLEGDLMDIDVEYYIFKTLNITDSNSISFGLSGTLNNDNTCNLSFSGSESNVSKIDGNTICYDDGDPMEAYGTHATINFDIENILLSFKLEEGTNTYTSNSFKDNFSLSFDYDFTTDPDIIKPTFPDYGPSVYTTKTTQVITINMN